MEEKTKQKQGGKSPENGGYAPPYTAFTDQPVKLFCPGYECTDKGVRTENGQLVCLHPILPTGALRNADDMSIRMKVAFRASGRWETAVLPRAKIASATGILELADLGVAVTNDNARALSTYLTKLFYANDGILETKVSLSRLGWLTEYGDRFAPYDDALEVDTEQAFFEKLKAVHLKGREEKWLEAVRPLIEKSLQARLALDASFASVLLPLMQLQPFFVHLWGRTGLGKTVLLQLAASVWGDPRPGKLLGTFNATGVGLETTAAFLHHLPVCIDELQILSAAGRTDFQQTIYLLSEGTGRTRGAKDGGLRKQNTWCCTFLTTGERPLNSEFSYGGAVNRSIELELEEPVTEDFAFLANALQNNYGFAGYRYTEFVKSKRHLLENTYNTHLRELLDRGVSGKQAFAMAALLTADDYAGASVLDPKGELPGISYDTAAALLIKDAEVCREAQGVNYLFDMIAANPAKFPDTKSPYQNYEVWGKPRGEYTAVIGTVFDKLMRDGGYDPRAVLSYASRQGLLQKGDLHNKMVVRFGNKNVRCVVIKPDLISAETQNDEPAVQQNNNDASVAQTTYEQQEM